MQISCLFPTGAAARSELGFVIDPQLVAISVTDRSADRLKNFRGRIIGGHLLGVRPVDLVMMLLERSRQIIEQLDRPSNDREVGGQLRRRFWRNSQRRRGGRVRGQRGADR